MILADFLSEAGEQPIYYFAYGMLTDPEIMAGLDLVGVASLPNFRYEMFTYANVIPDAGSVVYGCLWKVDRRVIANLDRIEGYPQLYDRKVVPAYVDGIKYPAELYTMTPATREQLQGRKPSQGYINKIVRGYEHAGVPLTQLRLALKHLYKNTVDEAAMNPTAFAAAINQGQQKGVLVGFEFEVLLPAATIGKKKKAITAATVQKIFNESDYWDYHSPDRGGITVEKFNSLFKLKPEAKPAFESIDDALDSMLNDKLKQVKEIFYQVPEDVRERAIEYANRRRPTAGKNIADQLQFGRYFANAVEQYASARRNYALKQLVRPIQDIYVPDWDDVLKTYMGPRFKIRQFSNYFDYDPATVYKEINLDEYSDEYNDDDYDDYGYDYTNSAKILKPALTRAFNRKVRVFYEYHEDTKNLKDWYIEPDGSLTPDNEDDGAAEIVSPPLGAAEAMSALKNFYAMARQLNLYTNSSTGLHINVSIPGNLDILKLAVFLGDQYVLKQFGRQDNRFAVGTEKNIAQAAASRKSLNLKALETIARDATDFHTASVSNSGKYISFRHAGGDYLADYQKIVLTVGRFIRAMIIAADPDAYAQEYQSKVAKLLQSNKPSAGEDVVSQLRTNGLPVLTVDLYIPGKTKLATILRQMGLNTFSVINTQPSSIEAKQKISSTMRDPARKEEAIGAPVAMFMTLTLSPVDANGIQQVRQLDDTRGVQVVWYNGARRGYSLIKKGNIPPTDPATQTVLKTILKQQYKK